jgi:tRNA U54 and U55 pseudouridine synthase Pus10
MTVHITDIDKVHDVLRKVRQVDVDTLPHRVADMIVALRRASTISDRYSVDVTFEFDAATQERADARAAMIVRDVANYIPQRMDERTAEPPPKVTVRRLSDVNLIDDDGTPTLESLQTAAHGTVRVERTTLEAIASDIERMNVTQPPDVAGIVHRIRRLRAIARGDA